VVLVDGDEQARLLGLMPGMTLTTARALHPVLHVHEAQPDADRAWLNALADAAERYTPLVGLYGDDCLLLDITGAAHLYGGEAGLLADARARIQARGLHMRAAIAGHPVTARAAALYGAADIVAPGQEAEAIQDLPIAALDLDAARRASLERLGLKRIGDCLSRPRAPFAERFGRDFMARLDAIAGRVETPISPRRAWPACIAERRFAEPIGHEDDIRRSLLTLAADLKRILEKRGQGARCLELAFFRTDGATRIIMIETGRPLRDPSIIMRLFREKMDGLSDPLDPGFGFDALRLSARHVEAWTDTATRLDADDDYEEALAALIDRLAARFGAHKVQRLAALNSHAPARASRLVPAQHASAAALDFSAFAPLDHEAPARPIRLMEPPERIDVLAEVPDGPPIRFRWRRVLHAVIRADGPERIAPEWWRTPEGAATRDYYRVEDEHGRRFWLYREGLYDRDASTPRWFLHGLFA
jgi:protein ImuB